MQDDANRGSTAKHKDSLKLNVIKDLYLHPVIILKTKARNLKELRAQQISALKWIGLGLVPLVFLAPVAAVLLLTDQEPFLFYLVLLVPILFFPVFIGALVYIKTLLLDFPKLVKCPNCGQATAQLVNPLPISEKLRITSCPHCKAPITIPPTQKP